MLISLLLRENINLSGIWLPEECAAGAAQVCVVEDVFDDDAEHGHSAADDHHAEQRRTDPSDMVHLECLEKRYLIAISKYLILC